MDACLLNMLLMRLYAACEMRDNYRLFLIIL